MNNGDDTTGPVLQRIEAKLDRQDVRLTSIEARLDSIETTLLDHGSRFGAIGRQLEATARAIEAKIELVRVEVQGLVGEETRFARIAARTDSQQELDRIRAELAELMRRLDALEKR